MGRKRSYRKKKGGGIEAIVILTLLLQALIFVFIKVKEFFMQLTVTGWISAILFSGFLYFTYHLAKDREKKYKVIRKEERQRQYEEYRIKQRDRLRAKN